MSRIAVFSEITSDNFFEVLVQLKPRAWCVPLMRKLDCLYSDNKILVIESTRSDTEYGSINMAALLATS